MLSLSSLVISGWRGTFVPVLLQQCLAKRFNFALHRDRKSGRFKADVEPTDSREKRRRRVDGTIQRRRRRVPFGRCGSERVFEANALIRSISEVVNTLQLFRSRSTSLTFPLISHRFSVTAETPIACAAWLRFIVVCAPDATDGRWTTHISPYHATEMVVASGFAVRKNSMPLTKVPDSRLRAALP